MDNLSSLTILPESPPDSSEIDEAAYYSEPENAFTTKEDDEDEFHTMRFDEPFRLEFVETPHRKQELHFFLWLRSEIVGKPANEALKAARPISQLDELIAVPRYVEQTLAVGLMLCTDALFHEMTFMPVNVLFGFLRRIMWPYHRGLTITEKSELTRLSLLAINAYLVATFVDFTTVYHFVRSQSFMKLYVFFNMLEIFERLLRSMGLDFIDALMISLRSSVREFLCRYLVVLLYCFIHSSMHFIRLLLFNVAINSSHDNIVFLLVVTNNFGEIKSTCFKKFEAKGLFVIVASDIVERSYLCVDVIIVLTRMMASPRRDQFDWITAFFWVSVTIFVEIMTDWIKYCFITKSNKLTAQTFRHYKHLMCLDVKTCRSASGPDFSGIYGFSHIPVRRVGFAALPLGSLVVTHITLLLKRGGCTPNHTVAIMISAFILAFLLKVFMSIFLVGYALKKNLAKCDIPEALHSCKAL